jgi:hypothetical protein
MVGWLVENVEGSGPGLMEVQSQLVSRCELDGDHYGDLLPVEESGRLHMFDEVCLYRESLPKTLSLERSIALRRYSFNFHFV